MLRRLSAEGVFLLVATCVLIWPAFLNGQPFFHSDTPAYIRGADAGIERLTGMSTAWTQTEDVEGVPNDTPVTREAQPYTSLSSIKDKAVLSGRSVYYGALLYLGYVSGDYWPTVAVQALAIIFSLAIALRAMNLTVRPFLGIVLAVAALTPAPFFASFLMPDLFAALTVLTCSVLIAGGPLRDRRGWVFLFVLLTFSLWSHSSHVLLAAALLGLGVIGHLVGWLDSNRRGLVLILAALIVSYLGEIAFNYAVTRFVGEPPIRPPFLMARTISDGPGYRYMRMTCPDNGFVVCMFIDRLPLYPDEFLWLRDPSRGVFAASDAGIRRALSREQYRFVLSVIAHDPWGQASASIRNAVRQARLMALPEFEYIEQNKEQFVSKIPEKTWVEMQRTNAYLGTMPIHWFSLLSYLSTGVGFGYLIYAFVQNRLVRRPTQSLSLDVAVFVIAGVIANAVICGALSTPHHRYQARVVWLLPVMAMIVDFALREKWWKRVLEKLNFRSRHAATL